MTREEQRKQASILHSEIVRNNSNIDEDFIAGAVWADNNPRTDIIGEDSINRVRMILLSNFCKIAKKYPDKTYDKIPEMKEAYDLVDNFDKACEIAGFELDDDIGFYKTKRNV